MPHRCDTKRSAGFTLVELIVVLTVLATLAALLIPSLTSYIEKAHREVVIVKARAALVAAQSVMTEAYAREQLTYDRIGGSYRAPGTDDAHAMAKEILTLSESDQDHCEWRFSLAAAIDTSLPAAAIDCFEYCDKSYYVTYRATATEEQPAGWSAVQAGSALPPHSRLDPPIFLSSADYKPEYYRP